MNTNNELTVYQQIDNPLLFAEQMGKAMANSGMFDFNDQAGMVVAMTCLAERITPIEFLRTYHIIQNKPSMRSDAMLAEFRKAGGKHKVLKRSPEEASVYLRDADGEEYTSTLTWEDAQKEDFTTGKDGDIKENYKYPRKRMQMLWARAISDGVRTLAPEIVAGIYSPEEVEDIVDGEVVHQPPKMTTEQAMEIARQNALAPFVADPNQATDLQVARIEGLFQQLQFPQDKIQQALQKRGVSSIDQLTKDDADQMIEKLQGVAASKK